MPDQNPIYRTPPSPLAELIDAPPTPSVSMCPNRIWMAMASLPSLPPIEEVAEPELRLAGIRINPLTSDHSRQGHLTGVALRKIDDPTLIPVQGLPEQPRLRRLRWSPDGARLAVTVMTPEGGQLWIIEVATAQARKLSEATLSATLCGPYRWSSCGEHLICCLIPEDRGPTPQAPAVPAGPIIEENDGRKAPARTWQDLLTGPHDEALFDHFGRSTIARVDLDGRTTPLGPPDLYTRASPSPDGRHLLVDVLHRPFSYLVPVGRFPRRVEVWDQQGRRVHLVADLPLAEEIPIGFSAARTGPRAVSWRPDKPSTLSWIEAQDGGDPEIDAGGDRDRLFTLDAPFDAPPREVIRCAWRISGGTWRDDQLLLVSEAWWKTRRIRTWQIRPGQHDAPPRVLFERSWEDRYGDPGHPLMTETKAGDLILRTTPDGRAIYLIGEGASPEGNRPFLDTLDLETHATERLWQCQGELYEHPIDLFEDGRTLLTRREAVEEPPNFFLRDLDTGDLRALTDFPHPTPQLLGIHKELIRYERHDGVGLTGTLYLPAGYDPAADGPLPTLLWAYPREFKSAQAAGQVRDSPHRFVRVGWWSPILWVTRGFAVLDDPTMPIVGEGEAEPNDTYIAQLTAGARAAIETLAARGVTDPARVAIGGHSYGAFMAANLLAHSDLFAAGVARSGAYNRTLTPFGFQAEERTLWQAPQSYAAMSPFMFADKITAPLLLIHGAEDNNSGTFPMQSERFYQALKGHGGRCRLVMLPHESHAYRAFESIMHVTWETDQWLQKHVRERVSEGAQKADGDSTTAAEQGETAAT